ncbi:MAG TPA: SPOR domain-containing protein [Gammaproteobacteria bacterium]|nr:SPOR domain-containing protein [Gammaproteobacteria bacterium]
MKQPRDLALDARWRVRRQDDNGNVFEVARELTRAAAERLAATLSAGGHKQLYWVERNS